MEIQVVLYTAVGLLLVSWVGVVGYIFRWPH